MRALIQGLSLRAHIELWEEHKQEPLNKGFGVEQRLLSIAVSGVLLPPSEKYHSMLREECEGCERGQHGGEAESCVELVGQVVVEKPRAAEEKVRWEGEAEKSHEDKERPCWHGQGSVPGGARVSARE